MRLQLSALGARPLNTQQPAPFTPHSNKSIVNTNTPALAQRQGISSKAYTDAFLRYNRIKDATLLRGLSTRVESYLSILGTMIEHFTSDDRTLDITAIDGYLRKLRTQVPEIIGLKIDEEERLYSAIFSLRNELVPIQTPERLSHLQKLFNHYDELLFDIKVALDQD
ncbi:MAG: hypothetical protein ACK551_07005 [Vampirovibrionales bacterium]